MAWYVAVTVARGESKALDEIRQNGMNGFLPTMQLSVFDRRKNVKTLRTFPLFNKYLFVENPAYAALHDCRSVVSLLGNNGTPCVVRDLDVERVRAAVSLGIFDKKPVEPGRLHKGQTVRIISGQLTGFFGQVSSAEGKQLVKLMVDFFGRTTQVSIPLDDLAEVA